MKFKTMDIFQRINLDKEISIFHYIVQATVTLQKYIIGHLSDTLIGK